MRYRVVETLEEQLGATLGEFSTAYAAVDYMTSSCFRGEPCWSRMQLIDDRGEVLLTSYDLVEACTHRW